MKTEQFLNHHGISGDPFSEEDAQTDAVFKSVCLRAVHHPAWTKFFGSPSEPSTAIVFGEKGSGKTALKLQTIAELDEYNRAHPDSRVFMIAYDDFNPPLDHVKAALNTKDPLDVLKRLQLHDHIDAILSLGMTRLVDQIKSGHVALPGLPSDVRRDLLMLTALYDQSTAEPIRRRWSWLRRHCRFRAAWQRRDLLIGIAVTAAIAIAAAAAPQIRNATWIPWLALALVVGWLPFAWRWLRAELRARELRASLRVLRRDPAALRSALAWFEPGELAGQPLPEMRQAAGEERYELLRKFQGVLGALGYRGVVVLIDRVDEPQLIEGDPRKMRALVWPMLDHKFLRHPGLGMKMLLPLELAYYLEKEDKAFYDRARPDKLNMVKPLRWSGPSLYDLATDRLRACATKSDSNGAPRLRQLVDTAISDDALKDALGHLRTPRQLFKFLHRLLQEHCHRFTEDDPRWTIDADTFRMVYGTHMRELDAFDRGFGHG